MDLQSGYNQLPLWERGASCQGHFLWIYLNFLTTRSANWMNESDSDFNSPCIDRLAFWNTLTQNSENKKNSKKKFLPTCPTYGVSCRTGWGKLAACRRFFIWMDRLIATQQTIPLLLAQQHAPSNFCQLTTQATFRIHKSITKKLFKADLSFVLKVRWTLIICLTVGVLKL